MLMFAGRHADYGTAVFAHPALVASGARFDETTFSEAYATFYPANASLRAGLTRKIGHITPRPMPTEWRRPGQIVGKEIRSWIIENTAGERVTRHLTDEEADLPIAEIWNHEMLLTRVAEKWRPNLLRQENMGDRTIR